MAGVEDICDIAKLRKCNDLLWKWFVRTGQNKRQYYKWVINCWKDPASFKKTLPINMRSAFAKDSKTMFYAADVESDMIIQYQAMVSHIMKKLRYSSQDHDDLYVVGLHAVRMACWQFRTVSIKCNFTTFCFSSIYMRLCGELSKKSVLKLRRDKKATLSFANELHQDFNIEKFVENRPTLDHTEVDETEVLIENIIKKAALEGHELYLFKLLLKRANHTPSEGNKVWYSSYFEKYKHTFPNGKITKQGFHQRLVQLQQKIWFVYHVIEKKQVPIMPKFKMQRAI